MKLLLGALLWLVRLVAGPAAAREAGRQDARTDQLTRTIEVQRAQLEISAAPGIGRDALVRRLRDGDL
mgnify:CR=1 FL=1